MYLTLSVSPLVGSTAEEELEAASPCLLLILGPGSEPVLEELTGLDAS